MHISTLRVESMLCENKRVILNSNVCRIKFYFKIVQITMVNLHL